MALSYSKINHQNSRKFDKNILTAESFESYVYTAPVRRQF